MVGLEDITGGSGVQHTSDSGPAAGGGGGGAGDEQWVALGAPTRATWILILQENQLVNICNDDLPKTKANRLCANPSPFHNILSSCITSKVLRMNLDRETIMTYNAIFV